MVMSCSSFMCFFFSSRRRHTCSLRDWSSDVCSSDLRCVPEKTLSLWRDLVASFGGKVNTESLMRADLWTYLSDNCLAKTDRASMAHGLEVRRSEERRVGKEGRAACAGDQTRET